jgi:phosphate transport system substrate-binding protein
MADQQGRCNNTEYCSNATTRRVIQIPEGAPMECPKCGEKLEALQEAKRSQRNRSLLLLQAAVIVLGGGGVAYKLLSGVNTPAPANSAPAAASAADAAPPAAPAVETASAPASAPASASGEPAAQAAPAAAASVAAPPATILLHLAGSDVVGSKLARRLASGYLAMIGDTDIATAQSAGGVAVIGNQAGEHEGIGIGGGSSASGFQALLRGRADIALSVRPPQPAELDRLGAVGDMTNPANEHVVAVEAVAAIVGGANRVPALSVAQLHDIFSGRITDWREVGGAPGPIRAVIEDDRAGATDTAADMVLAGTPAARGAVRLASEGAVAANVAADRSAIGLVSLSHAGTARVLDVAAPGTAPAAPTDLAVSTEDYPLTRRVYFYNGSAANNFVRRFTDYVASPAGQAAVEAAGFVPLTLKAAPVAVPVTASARLREVVAGATRVSVDFRFEPGSVKLDSRAVRDLDRLVTFLRTQHADGSRLILAGFADSSGDPAANQAVAQQRANALAAALVKFNIRAGRVEAFGADVPVADNATPEGRERNRRVEVYLAGS